MNKIKKKKNKNPSDPPSDNQPASQTVRESSPKSSQIKLSKMHRPPAVVIGIIFRACITQRQHESYPQDLELTESWYYSAFCRVWTLFTSVCTRREKTGSLSGTRSLLLSFKWLKYAVSPRMSRLSL